jgi:MFS transporter, DHA1 family, multidrug resistance protein
MSRTRLITIGYLGTILTTVLNLVLVLAFPDPSGSLDASLLPVLIGPLLMSFTACLFFAPVQLEILDLFPHERGAAASLGTFFTLVMNALLSGVIAPLISVSLTAIALAALGYVLVGSVLWAWHLHATRRPQAGSRAG